MSKPPPPPSGPSYFWVPDNHDVWSLGVQTIEGLLPNGCIRVELMHNKKSLDLSATHLIPTSSYFTDQHVCSTVEDLVSLPEVNQPAILFTTKARFFNKKIYTSLGQVLMLVNPFEKIHEYYGEDVISKYKNPYAENLPSHLYLVPSRAFNAMITFQRNQSILISGESGAGKTEATKECISFLTKLSTSERGQPSELPTKRPSVINSRALHIADSTVAVSPILEAFGNAQTLRNPNSSRFGKWLELIFDDSFRICGSTITSYLLEKSRITQHDSKERNFHIFYQLIRSGDQKILRKFHLVPNTKNYKYLSIDGAAEAVNLNDAARFKETIDSFAKMGFSKDLQDSIFRIISAILILGNVKFDDNNTSDGGAIVSRIDGGGVFAAEMLKISFEQLELCLCTKTMLSGGIRKSVIQMKLNKETATFARDTLSRTLYEKLFEFIIGNINTNNANSVGNIVSSSIKSVDVVNTIDSSSSIDLNSNNLEDKFHIIGLLDIFGFEIFETNSFEQLCINYCNEMLQDHFNSVIFTMEKQLYLDEGISCETIEFKDNAMTIKEIVILFKLLDEEGRVKGTSKSWYDKHKRQNNNSTNKKVAAIISYPVKKDVFKVNHYAGSVEYSPIDFLEKNSEVVTNEITAAMKSSECPVISELFGGGASATVANAASEAGKGPSQLHSSTISYVFQKQLNALMGMLKSCDSHFIRCIKSNEECKPMSFDHSLVQRQLLYSGIFEIIKIQQSGLPVRLKHLEFVNRFRCLIKSNNRWDKIGPKNLLDYFRKTLNVPLTSAQIGNNLIFFKGNEFASIEAKKLEIQTACVIRIQSRSRMFSIYKNYKSLLVHLRQFAYYASDIDYENSAKAAREIISYSNAISKLDDGILNHLVRKIEVKVKKVFDQSTIISEISSFKASRSASKFDKMNVLLKKATDLNLNGHKLVSEVSDLYDRYQTAVEFSKKVKTANKSALKVMSLDAVDLGIKCMGEFSDVIPEAEGIIDEAEHWKNRIENEVTQILNPLMILFESERVSFDHKTGQIILANTTDGISNGGSKLKAFFKDINYTDLECQDTRLLFEDVKMFLKVIDEFVPFNRGHDAIDLIEAYQPASDLAKQQFLVLHHWSECHLADKLLKDRLKIGPIPATSTGKEVATAVNHIIELRESISMVEQGDKVNNVLRVAEHLIKIRSAFIEGDFTVLKDMLRLAENEHKILSRFSEYPDVLIEMGNAYWQINHHIYLQDLTRICTMQSFNGLIFNSDDWTGLISDIESYERAIDDASVFAFPNGNDAIEDIVASTKTRINLTSKNNSPCPYLADMIEVAKLILSIRKDFYEDALARSEQINSSIATLMKEYTVSMKYVDIFPIVSNEIAICIDLLQSLRLEDKLHICLTYSRTKPFIYSSDSDEISVHDPSLVGDTVSLDEAISETEDFLDTTVARGANYHAIANSLQNQVKVASAILKGRQMLLGYELIDGLTFDKIDVLRIEYKAIEDDEEYGSVFEQYRFELTIILSELIRRQVIYKLRNILNAKVITGVLCVNICANKEVYDNCFAQLQSANETISKEMSLIPTNIAMLQRLCSILMDVRKAVKDDRFEDEVIFDTFLDALVNYPSQDIIVWLECENYFPEIDCVRSEYEVRRDMKLLKASLAKQPINILRDPSARCSLLYYDETIKYLTTDNIRGPCEKLTKYVRVNKTVRDLIVLSSHYANLITTIKTGKCAEINLNSQQATFPISKSEDDTVVCDTEEKDIDDTSNATNIDDGNQLSIIENLCRKHGVDDTEYKCLKRHVITMQLFKSINNALNKTVRLNNNNTVFHNTIDYSAKVKAIKNVLSSIDENAIKLPANYTKWLNIINNYILLLESIPKQDWLLIIGRARCVEEVIGTVLKEVLYDPKNQEMILKYIKSDTKIALLLSLELREIQKKVKSHTLPDEILFSSPHKNNPNLTASHGNGSSMYIDLNDSDSSTESLRDELLDSLSTPYKTPLSAYFAKLHDYYYHSGSPTSKSELSSPTRALAAENASDDTSKFTSSFYTTNSSDVGSELDKSEFVDLVHSVAIVERDRAKRRELLIAQDKANPYGIHNLRRAGYEDSDLVEGNYPLEVFWAVGIDAALLRKKCRHPSSLLAQAGFECADLFEANYSLKELRGAGFTTREIRASCNVSIRDLKHADFTITEILDSGVTAEHLKAAGYDAHKLSVDMQIDTKQLLNCGFSLFELRAADITAHQLKQAGVTDCKQLRSVGYDSVRLKSAGFDAVAMKSAGYNYYDLRAIGYHDERLLAAGFEADMTNDILCEFYRNTNGNSWINSANWCTNRHMREWFGLTVDEGVNNGYCVTAIRLPSNNLCGHLSDRICHLRHLKTLILGDNSLMGSVPQSISLMTELKEFDILYNPLLDGNNSFISRSNARGNSAQTSNSEIIHDATFASSHDGEWNALMDLFQDTNGTCWKNNKYWGDDTIPVGNWFGVTVNDKNKVIKIVLNCNRLEGCIPDSIKALKYLQVLDLRYNNIIGSIPSSIGSLKRLVYLHLHCNHLTCEIPESIGQLTKLKVLDLRSNKLMGIVPKCVAELKRLSYIALSSNVLKNGTYAEVKKMLPQCHTISC